MSNLAGIRDLFSRSSRQHESVESCDFVDVSRAASKAGFEVPVALTAAVWHRYVRDPIAYSRQDEAERIWEILCMFRAARKQAKKREYIIRFTLLVWNGSKDAKPMELKAVFVGYDRRRVTLMLPEEIGGGE